MLATLSHRKMLLLALALAAASFIAATRRMSHSVWFDESQTVRVARQATAWDITSTAMRLRAYPPLFFFVAHYSLGLRDDEIGLRLPAAIFGALAVVAVFLLGKALFDDVTGAIAAYLFAFAPGVLRYFVDGNAYTLLVLFSLLSTLFLYRACSSGSRTDWLGYFVLALLGLGSHTVFVFYFFAQAAAGFYLQASASQPTSRSWRRFAVTMLALLSVELLWALFFFSQGGDRRPMQWMRLLDAGTLFSVAGMVAGPLSLGDRIQLALWTLIVMSGASVVFLRSRRTFWFLAVLALVSSVGLVCFLKMTLPYVAYKHGLGIFPLACIVGAQSWRLVHFPCRHPPSGLRLFTGIMVCVSVSGYGLSGAAFVHANPRAFEYQDWRGAASCLMSCARSSDAVVLTGRYDFDPLSYYYHGPAELVEARAANRVDVLVARLLAQSEPPKQSVWIVVSTFENESPMVARFTETHQENLESRVRNLLTALREQGLSVREVARFHRVLLLQAKRNRTPG
jgi:hypothetical protein